MSICFSIAQFFVVSLATSDEAPTAGFAATGSEVGSEGSDVHAVVSLRRLDGGTVNLARTIVVTLVLMDGTAGTAIRQVYILSTNHQFIK